MSGAGVGEAVCRVGAWAGRQLSGDPGWECFLVLGPLRAWTWAVLWASPALPAAGWLAQAAGRASTNSCFVGGLAPLKVGDTQHKGMIFNVHIVH